MPVCESVREVRNNGLLRLFTVTLLLATSSVAHAADAWDGKKTAWHGYDRYDFRVDEHPAYVVLPKKAVAGNPWIWRARFPDYHAEMDQMLLARGFHVGYVDVAGLFGCPQAVERGDRFYRLMTEEHGLAAKPVLEGVSRGGLFVYNWAIAHPDRVACIYCDTPVMDFKSWPGGKGKGLGSERTWKQCLQVYGLSEEQALAYGDNPVDRVDVIVRAGIPVLHIVSESDQVVPPTENTYLAFQNVPEKSRRNFRVIKVSQGTSESNGHHFTHPNPQAVVAFIVQHALFEGGYVQTSDSRTFEQIESTYQAMPPLAYNPPPDRCRLLPKTRQRLSEAGSLRIVMLGDSIINDTSRSAWNLLLQRDAPNCSISKFTAVRGSTGCWFYQADHLLQRYVLDQRPDLVIIGGISHREDVEAIGQVIGKIRKQSTAEILLLSGTFGRVDPTDEGQWQAILHPGQESYRSKLEKLAQDLNVEYFDMRIPWAEYIRQSGRPLASFKRDVVHANEQGEQIIGRILYRYLRQK